MIEDFSRQKAALRARLVTARSQLSAAQRQRLSRRITGKCLARLEDRGSTTVFVYVSTDEEVATHALIEQLLARGRTVLIPRIRPGGPMEMVVFPGWQAMRPGTLGILAPADDLPACHEPVDAVVVPGVGFTLDGARLGYGGGYYDRWLAQHGNTLAIAVAFEVQLVASLPQGPYDLPVNHLETELRSVRVVRPDPDINLK